MIEVVKDVIITLLQAIKILNTVKLTEIIKRIHSLGVYLSNMVGINYLGEGRNKLFYKIMAKMDSMAMIYLLVGRSNKIDHYLLTVLKISKVI